MLLVANVRTVEPTEQHAVSLLIYVDGFFLCKNGVSNGVANLLEVLSVLMRTFQT